MLTSLFTLAALVATGFAQTATAPAGYRTVYISSMVNSKFVVVPKTPVKAGTTLVVQTLDNKPEQQWYLQSGKTKIQLAATTLCMDAGAKSNWKDMGSISLKDCSDTEPGQQWNVMADGRIALDASSPQECIDLQYMRATANNPVGLYGCAGLGNAGAGDKGINWPLVNVTASP
ncbi:ricin B lectin domain-containing protein [Diplogelasinospora grovesii]|uniref:Ricin B lectin domain-containing protein n=1 Tax=Diplogelasinospora grovesii TaxID=303347 RepID=A0AAN6N915_9PEZI|nr:ricin B lectin domain-containing protein [Diplogelasinospora grovesii]